MSETTWMVSIKFSKAAQNTYHFEWWKLMFLKLYRWIQLITYSICPACLHI